MPSESDEDELIDEDADDEEDFTLDDLGAAYAEAMVEAGLMPEVAVDDQQADGSDQHESDSHVDEPAAPTPEGVVEAALFIGHPENAPLSAKELARVMRDVSPKEVEAIIEELNRDYEEQGHVMRIEREAGGFRMILSPDSESVRRMFYGKVREARLSQQALEILALVAYQPGISANDLADQRGRDCGPLLNQLVRRRLLELTRDKSEGQGRPISRYHPTERFLNLFGLSSLEDLPQVEESLVMDDSALL